MAKFLPLTGNSTFCHPVNKILAAESLLVTKAKRLVQIGVKIVRNYEVAGDVSRQDQKSFGMSAEPLQAVSFPCSLAFNSELTAENCLQSAYGHRLRQRSLVSGGASFLVRK